jgi:NAD(P)-dependent dehydrogenase (short-subunit alcohol dehydrogenase family)
MNVKGKIVLITGAASGIGAALARRFLAEGAKGLILGDVQEQMLSELVLELNGNHDEKSTSAVSSSPIAYGLRCDVTREADIQALVNTGVKHFGRVDIACSNAGLVRDGGEETSDEDWQLNWDIHLMAHVWLSRAVLPGMLSRSEGYLLITASAAGLLTSLPSTSYAVTKHASIAFAESMSIRHGASGVRVSVLCPQAVDTPLIQQRANVPGVSSQIDGVMSTDALCDTVIEGLASEKFLILPHPQVLEYFQRKATDYDRWLSGMRRLDQKLRLGKSA